MEITYFITLPNDKIQFSQNDKLNSSFQLLIYVQLYLFLSLFDIKYRI